MLYIFIFLGSSAYIQQKNTQPLALVSTLVGLWNFLNMMWIFFESCHCCYGPLSTLVGPFLFRRSIFWGEPNFFSFFFFKISKTIELRPINHFSLLSFFFIFYFDFLCAYQAWIEQIFSVSLSLPNMKRRNC